MTKWIAGYEGLYDIDTSGNVRRHYKNGKIKSVKAFDTNGYMCVALSNKSNVKRYTVHRLVAMSFIENNDINKTHVDHIDGNKLNNNIDKLRWCTDKENQEFREEQRNSGKEYGYNVSNKPIRILYDGIEYESKNKLAKYLSSIHSVTTKCVIKLITNAIKRNGTLYGKDIVII